MKYSSLSLQHFLNLIGLMVFSICLFPVRAETIDCTAITTLPYTITAQGIYCLTGNLSTGITSGNAIDIQTNNVTIDLNGYKLGGLAAGDGTLTNGIYANRHKNITIKNGIVRGFYRGIYLYGSTPSNSSGHVVQGLLADQNTYVGIEVAGLGNAVVNNTVVDTGNSTVVTTATGILIAGPGAKLLNNDISQTIGQGSSAVYGIYLTEADYALVQNNTVTDTIDDIGLSYAIHIVGSAGVFLRGNSVANADYGLYFTGSTGKYFNNLTFDVTTPFEGGTAIGSNNN